LILTGNKKNYFFVLLFNYFFCDSAPEQQNIYNIYDHIEMIRRFVCPGVYEFPSRPFDFGKQTGSLYSYENNSVRKNGVALISDAPPISSPVLTVNSKETLFMLSESTETGKSYIYDIENSAFHKIIDSGLFQGFLNGEYPVFKHIWAGGGMDICVVGIQGMCKFRINPSEHLFCAVGIVCNDIPFLTITTLKSRILYRFDPTESPPASVEAKFDFCDYSNLVYIGSGLFKCLSSENKWVLYDVLNSSFGLECSAPICATVPFQAEYIQNGVDISVHDPVQIADRNVYHEFQKFYLNQIEAARDFFYKEYYSNAMEATKAVRSIAGFNVYFEKKENDKFHYVQVVYRHNVGQNIQVCNKNGLYFFVDILNDGTMYDRKKSNKLIGKITSIHSIPHGPVTNRKYRLLLETTVDASARTYETLEITTQTVEQTAKLDNALDSIPHIHLKFDHFQLIARHGMVFGMMLPKSTINLIGYYISLIKSV